MVSENIAFIVGFLKIFHVASISALLCPPPTKYRNRQKKNGIRMHHCHQFLGEPRPPPPSFIEIPSSTLTVDIGLHPPTAADLFVASGSATDNAVYITCTMDTAWFALQRAPFYFFFFQNYRGDPIGRRASISSPLGSSVPRPRLTFGFCITFGPATES